MIHWLLSTWPTCGHDDYHEREAIMTIDASHPYVPAIREAFKDLVRVAERAVCQLSVI